MSYLILSIYVIAILNMHYRGNVRFPWSRQIMTHTNYLAPYNLLMNLCAKHPNEPFLDARTISDLQYLQENWETIRDEVISLAKEGGIKNAKGVQDVGFNSFFRTGWTRFYLKWYDDYMPSAIQKCPKTIEILKKTLSINAAMFASLPPGAVLRPHRDPYAGSLRYHLGLITPNSDNCYIKVDDKRSAWKDGEHILFDETFLHEAHNETDQQRIILFADVHRPMRYQIIDKFNHWVSDHIIKISTSQNDETEQVGFLNNFLKYGLSIRNYSKVIKKWNRNIYYSLKYMLFFGLIYLLFL